MTEEKHPDYVFVDDINLKNAEKACARCKFKEMSEKCPRGVKYPLCFAQENNFNKSLIFK